MIQLLNILDSNNKLWSEIKYTRCLPTSGIALVTKDKFHLFMTKSKVEISGYKEAKREISCSTQNTIIQSSNITVLISAIMTR